ncbi:MAG: Omp28-related outer membrane protein, partial [Crocinitomicaceae bacterium]
MKYFLVLFLGGILLLSTSCDRVENPYPQTVQTDLDTTLYPGNWSDYVANEWPQFSANSNTNRNVLIEDFTGHQCVFCPAAADLAHALHESNPSRVFTASIHSGPTGMGDFQVVSLPNYPTDFTNAQGLEIGTYFGTNDGGFIGNPRGTVNRFNNGYIFQSPAQWSSMMNDQLTQNSLKVNIQSALNYYPSTKGAFLHVEVEKLDQNLTNELGVVVYLLEDSLVGDQKMSDNSHNSSYVHRDIHRGNIDGQTFGRVLGPDALIGNKYYVNYSFLVPNQLNGNFNAENMHL